MANDELQDVLRAGIDAARRGERTTARRLLEQVITEDDRNEVAWMWLASVVNTLAERRNCLERVLEINPGNQRAQEALERLRSESAGSGSAATPARMSTDEQRRISQALRSAERPTGRPAARPAPATAATSTGGFDRRLLIVGGVIVGTVLLVATLSSLIGGALPAPPTATPTAVALAETETPTATFTPLPSPTSVPLELITPLATLPPAFTPTFTPTPTITPTPTPEPIALERFDMLYVSLNSGASQPDAYTMQGDGSNDSFFLPSARDVAFAPDGVRIAFVRDVEDPEAEGVIAPQIFVADFDDINNPRQLTRFSAPDTASPSWSPDGRRIVFSTSEGNEPDEEGIVPEKLWIIDADGGNLTRLTTGEGSDRQPAWSPMANEIAFISDRASALQTQLFLLTLPDPDDPTASPEIRQITTSGNNYTPTWTPDGRSIVFASDRFGTGNLFIVDRDGFSGSLILPELGDSENRAPSVSPDGRWVAFISNREGDFQVYALTLDGTALLRLTNNERSDQSVVFRPADVRMLE